jgi:hypothetical protein
MLSRFFSPPLMPRTYCAPSTAAKEEEEEANAW